MARQNEDEDESKGRSELILQQDMDDNTPNTAVISDIKLCLCCFLPLSGPVEYIT